MSAFHVFPLAVALMLSAAAVAQESPAPAPAPAAAPSMMMMPQDCAKAMARPDQGAEKGMPMSGTCPMAAAASPAKAMATRGHDHSKFHKLM